MKKRFIVCILLLLSLCMAIDSVLAEYDPVIVRVGSHTYHRSMLMKTLESSMRLYEELGNTLDNETMNRMKAEIVASYVELGVVENKLHELGLDVTTPEDEIELTRRANEAYSVYQKEYAKAIMERYECDEEKADRAAVIFMELDEIDLNTIREQERDKLLNERIIDYMTKDVPEVTDEEVEQFYQENYVTPCKERYDGDIATFEQEVIADGGETFYIPEGYRCIQNIVFYPDPVLQEQAYILREKLSETKAEAKRLDDALYGIRLLGEDDSDAKKNFETGLEAVAEAEEKLQAIYDKMAEPFKDQIEQLKARLEAGEDFETLRDEYDTNPYPADNGYLVCADSLIWEENFRDAAMMMKKTGDWTGPVYTNGGVQFLSYVQDAPQGAYPLEMNDVNTIKQQAQIAADNDLLRSYVKIWEPDYEVETHTELLIVR